MRRQLPTRRCAFGCSTTGVCALLLQQFQLFDLLSAPMLPTELPTLRIWFKFCAVMWCVLVQCGRTTWHGRVDQEGSFVARQGRWPGTFAAHIARARSGRSDGRRRRPRDIEPPRGQTLVWTAWGRDCVRATTGGEADSWRPDVIHLMADGRSEIVCGFFGISIVWRVNGCRSR